LGGVATLVGRLGDGTCIGSDAGSAFDSVDEAALPPVGVAGCAPHRPGDVLAGAGEGVDAGVDPQLPPRAPLSCRSARHAGDPESEGRWWANGMGAAKSARRGGGPIAALNCRYGGADDGIRTRDPNLGKVTRGARLVVLSDEGAGQVLARAGPESPSWSLRAV